jgi:acyl carrier protein
MSNNAISAQDVVSKCASFIAEQLQQPVEEIDLDTEFDDFGLDSAFVTAMLINLEEWLGIELPPSLVFEEPTLRRLGGAVCRQLEAV